MWAFPVIAVVVGFLVWGLLTASKNDTEHLAEGCEGCQQAFLSNNVNATYDLTEAQLARCPIHG